LTRQKGIVHRIAAVVKDAEETAMRTYVDAASGAWASPSTVCSSRIPIESQWALRLAAERGA